jgi:hypothetical protein
MIDNSGICNEIIGLEAVRQSRSRGPGHIAASHTSICYLNLMDNGFREQIR